MAGLRL